ncbi:MAG: LPS export ABC transporter ATP-binding protein [Candidatus Marinimicrobia bacterium]|nr:LPS export ABC transporter ATP-binding protein [Candidatus Neomarinimicrobiota bacterium]|tara:strand:- start:326 stop:1039 length:714 start_codon:yes stop_codon:yes gene_type:complete
MLATKKLIKKYNNKRVVDGVSIEVHKGEVVGLLGPNGAGKTTTFYMITGMISPTSGGVYLGDQDITSMPMYKRAQLGVGYLSQEPSVFTKLTVEDNLKLVLELTGYDKVKQSKMLEQLLDDFSIGHIRKSISMTLSGGERRRTEIARALIMNPDFILLDEPFSGIDPIAVEDIQGIVRSLKKQNIGILITDHNVRETLDITDRAYLLYEGKILKEGTADDLISDKDAQRLYLGSTFK